jgi:hypothetical protein
VDDRLPGAAQGLEGPLDQLVPRLGQHLDGDVVGDQVVLDELADEVEVGLAGGGEADLDLLVTHPDQQLEHAPLAVGGHRVDQGLVAVAEVDRAPARGLRRDDVGPGAVGQGDRGERGVLADRHRRRPLGVADVRVVLAHGGSSGAGGSRGCAELLSAASGRGARADSATRKPT